ncbi:MAG: RHS repeat-associated core domain-containing protein, partial [bacterium]
TSRLTQVGHQKEFGLVGNYISSSSVGSNNYEGTYYVHSDHIGSAAWITNQNGTAVQHLQYMAWGELFADQRSTDYSARYTFSGKERDAETGFLYFGFRYYLSEYSIWGGVDPLSDKYPSTSSYAYCNNNPVMLVDPDGRAHYVFNQNGEMLRNGNLPFSFDVFVVVDKNNNIIDSKSFNSTITDDGFKKHSIIDNYKFIINDNDKAQELFEFFANNMNVEWLLVKNNDNNASLITSRGEDYVNVITGDVTSSSISMTHNHPTETPYPSGMGQEKGRDIEAAKFYEDKNPQMKSFLYVKGIGFLEYNSKSLGVDFKGHRDYMEDIPVIQQ